MADVQTCIVQATCNTSTGNQTFAHATETFTAKLALFYMHNPTTALNTAVAHAFWGFGAADGTTQCAIAIRVGEDNVSTSDVRRFGFNDVCIAAAAATANTILDEATFVNFTLSGGKTAVTVNWTNAPLSAQQITVVLMGGADFTPVVGIHDLGTGTSAVDVALAFDPDLVMTFGDNDDVDGVGNAGSFGNYFMGWCTNPASTAEQFCFCNRAQDGQAQTNIGAHIFTNRMGAQIAATGSPTSDHEYTMGAHSSSTGFSVTSDVGTGNDDMLYVAMDLGGAGVKIGTLTTPTSTGNNEHSPLSFTPQLLQVLTTSMEATDTPVSSALSGAAGYYVTDFTDEASGAWADEFQPATTNTQTISDNKLNLPTHDGSTGLVATMTSADADGWTWNFSAVEGTAKTWIYCAIETDAAGSTFNLTATEALSFADPSTETADFPETSTEALSLVDVSTSTATLLRTLAETLSLVDASTEVGVFPETLTEALALADVSSADVGIFVSLVESLVLADVASEAASFSASIAESLAFSEDSSELADVVRTLVESLTLVDTAEGITGVSVSVAEALLLSDVSSEVATFARSILDAVAFSDSAAIATKVIGKILTEALIFTDVALATGGVPIPTGQRGGSSLSRAKMRRLERLQMLRRDDDEIMALIARLLK